MNEPNKKDHPVAQKTVNMPHQGRGYSLSKILAGHMKVLDPAVLKGSWLGIIIACSGFALDYFLNLALSQWLSPEDLGDYSVAVSLAVFGGMFALIGTDQALLKFLPHYLDDKDWARAKGILLFCAGVVLLASLLISLTTFFVFSQNSDPSDAHPSLLALFILPFVAFGLLTSKALRGFQHIVLSAAPINVALPILIIIGGFYMVKTDGGVTDWELVRIYGYSFIGVLVFQTFILGHHFIGPISNAKPKYDHKEWGTTSISLMIASVLFLAMEQMGLYMSELLADEEDVAIFAVLIKHARFLLIIFVAVNLTVLPFISLALKRYEQNEMQRLYGTSMHVVLWGGLIPLLVFIFKGKELLLAFGLAYEVGYHGLLILMSAYYLNFVAGFSVPFLQYAGYRKRVNISIFIALIIEIFLLALLLPDYGFMGAIWSIAMTLSALSIWFMYQSWSLLGLIPLKLHSN